MEYLSAKSGGERRRVARVLHTPELPFCNDARWNLWFELKEIRLNKKSAESCWHYCQQDSALFGCSNIYMNLKSLIQLKNQKNFGTYNLLHYICTHIIKM